MKSIKILFVFLLVLTNGMLYGQQQQVKKGNKQYKLKNYGQAIPFYEDALLIKESLPVQTKLAFCYRKTNKMRKAEKLYSEIVVQERAKPITYFYYGEALMSNEKYDEAKKWFEKFRQLEPDDERGKQMIEVCEQVKFITPYFKDATIYPFDKNSDADDNSPIFFQDGIVFSSDRKHGVNPLKQKSGWTGRNFIHIYFSSQTGEFTYGRIKQFSKKLNELNKNNANLTISADSTLAVFSRNSVEANQKNVYTMVLYQATSTDGDKWKDVTEIGFCRRGYNYMHPALSPDGQYLFFTSDKGRGEGGTDIYVSKRKKDGRWGSPQNLGPNINTSSHDGFPYYHHDGKLFFCSKGHVGFGGFDIFYSEQDENGVWKKAVNIGKPINSAYDDLGIVLTKDGEKGAFTSSRKNGDDDIYLFWPNGNPNVPSEEMLMSDSDTLSVNSTDILNDIPKTYDDNSIKKEKQNIDTTSQKEDNNHAPGSGIQEVTKQEKHNVESRSAIKNNEVDNTVLSESELPPSNIPETDRDEKKKTNSPSENQEDTGARIISNEALLVHEEKQMASEDKPTTTIVAPVDVKEKEESTPSTSAMEADVPVIIRKNTLNDLKKDFKRDLVAPGYTYRLHKIKYTPGSYLINNSISKEMDKLIALMNTHPAYKFELSSHTNCIGKDETNLMLSQNRATQLRDYLLKKDIPKERFISTGYGEKQILNHCTNGVVCTQEEHGLNDRIEVKIIGNE